MSEGKQPSSGNSSDVFSDERIRDFLLGRQRADDQARFEEFLLVDDEFEKRVRLAEFELADDYSFERLSAEERELFTRNFLVTEERGQTLAASQALNKALAGIPETSSAKQNKALRLLDPRLFRFDRPVVRFVLGFAALLLFGGLLWLVLKSSRVPRPQVAVRQPASSPGREYAHPVRPPLPSGTDPSARATVESGRVATWVLQPGKHHDEQEVHFTTSPTERDFVRLELLLESHQSATYEGDLSNTAGKRISVASELKPVIENGLAKIVWDVSAHLLSVGDYRIRITRVSNGQVSEVSSFSFRVR